MDFASNTATKFALGGVVLAALIALPFFGWYWVYLPCVVSALLAIYFVSLKLGDLVESKVRRLSACLLAGIGVAIATVWSGVAAFGIMGVFLAWIDSVIPARTGMGPFYSLGSSIEDFIVKPLFWVSVFGGWIAIILGMLYGVTLHSVKNSSR